MRQKGFAHLFLIIIVVLVVIGAVGYLGYQNAQLKKQTGETVVTSETSDIQASPSEPSVNVTPNSDQTEQDATTTTEGDLQTIVVPYTNQPSWETYVDDIAGFSIQYIESPQGEFNSHLKVYEAEKGKYVKFHTCNTPVSGPNSGKELCFRYFDIDVRNNYSGGSRRQWLKSNYYNINNVSCTPIYFANVQMADSNAILATSDCSSFGETYVAIPKGNSIITFFSNAFSYNNDTNEFKLNDHFKKYLSTFKFIE
ncbi:hypothetical protein JXA63_00225 [Candidatus Woesebacteria bacterium]|nr:hypothetical protein [Candidatus Woesebacteria bacterium]